MHSKYVHLALVAIFLALGASRAAQAAIITGETATLPNHPSNPDPSPIVNDAGIQVTSGSPNLAIDGHFVHLRNDDSSMHRYINDPTPAPANGDRYFQIDLNGPSNNGTFYVGGMRIWNYNQFDGPTF